MKKNLLIALFATASMAGVAQAYTPVATSTDDSINLSSAGIAGNWSLEISLNANTLTNMFQNEAKRTILDYVIGNYHNSQALGQGLFTVNGSAYRQIGAGANRTQANNLSTTFIAGWGNSWYYGLADNGVAQGFQMGVAAGDAEQYKAQGSYYSQGYDMGIADSSGSVFDVYRFDTKLNGEKATIDSFAPREWGWDWELGLTYEPDSTLKFTSADLVVVHTTDGDIAKTESDTAIYLTLNYTVDGESGSVLYSASINDICGTEGKEGSLTGGSGYYDIDNVTSITGINQELVDKIIVYDQAVEVKDGKIDHSATPDTPAAAVPEPTTATLSLLALAGLCARRRRR